MHDREQYFFGIPRRTAWGGISPPHVGQPRSNVGRRIFAPKHFSEHKVCPTFAGSNDSPHCSHASDSGLALRAAARAAHAQATEQYRPVIGRCSTNDAPHHRQSSRRHFDSRSRIGMSRPSRVIGLSPGR